MENPFVITRPGIATLNDRGGVEAWRSVKPGDEVWFILKFGAPGTRLGGFDWYLVNEEQMSCLRFGHYGEKNFPTQGVVGLGFPNERTDLDEKQKERLSDFMFSLQCLLSAVTGFATSLDLEPPRLEHLDQCHDPQRYAVIKFLEPKTPAAQNPLLTVYSAEE